MSKPAASGTPHIFLAMIYSLHGLRATFRHEEAFRHELAFALVMSVLAVIIADELAVLLILLILPWLTLVVELLNSAVESTVDLISEDYHELAGRAKDQGSAAVFVLLTITAVSYVIALCA